MCGVRSVHVSLGPCRRQSAGTTRSSSLRGGEVVARRQIKGFRRWLVVVLVILAVVMVGGRDRHRGHGKGGRG